MEDFSFQGRRHIKRDYYNKTFSNPYFNKKPKSGSNFNVKLYIQALSAIFLVYLIVYSSLFQVKNVEVKGTDMINPADIQSIANANAQGMKWLIFPGRNLIFVSSNKIKSDIASRFALNKLEVNKGWQKLEIVVEEKPAHLIAKTPSSYFFIDANGVVTKELSADELSKYKSIFPELDFPNNLKINDAPVSGRAVSYALDLATAFNANNIKLKNFESREVDQINAVTEAGWKAYFNINSPINESMANLLLILNKKLAGKKFEYIDLRFGDHVSYFPDK